jgi:NTE family protein
VPDIIVGTSIGALVGGCEIAGILPELEEFALSLTRRRVFALLDIPWSGGGLISGNKLTELLESHLGDTLIQTLPRKYAAVATELATGHEIWLTEGNLNNAMRASYALPGIFAPVKITNKWMIDGAVVNPIPVSVCRALGARYVIAINLNTETVGTGTVIQDPRRGKSARKVTKKKNKAQSIRQWLTGSGGGSDEAPGISTSLVAAYTISQDRLARSRMAGDPPDMVIAPKAPDIGLFDFDKARESIAAGEQAVESALGELEHAMITLEANGA